MKARDWQIDYRDILPDRRLFSLKDEEKGVIFLCMSLKVSSTDASTAVGVMS